MSDVLKQVQALALRMVRDDPDIVLSHLCAELCRASCGVGKYAVRYTKPAASPPAKAAGGGKKVKQGRLL